MHIDDLVSPSLAVMANPLIASTACARGAISEMSPLTLLPTPQPIVEPPWYVFISSLYTELAHLREILYDMGTPERPVYVDEVWRKHDPGSTDKLLQADELLRRVRIAPIFICILKGGRHGALIPVHGAQSNVSFFEIELYQAALLRKHIHVVVQEGFTPEPRLEKLLSILAFAMPRNSWIAANSDAAVVDAVRRIMDAKSRVPSPSASILRRLVTALWRFGGVSHAKADIPGPQFLADAGDETSDAPDFALAHELLGRREIDQERQLARTWLVFRELMSVPWQQHHDKEIRECWNQAYEHWAGAAAWYGVHCHQPLACLAALKSMAILRSDIRAAQGGKARSPAEQHPGGAIGSACYSLAKLLLGRRERIRHFREAASHINRSIDAGEGDLSGLLAVRGSIHRATFRFIAAINDYKEVLRLRQAVRADATAIGDALSELGLGYCCVGRVVRGRQLMSEGLTLLRSKETGFLVRSLRKMEYVNRLTGHLREAAINHDEADRIARQLNLLDQIRQMQ